MRRRKPHVVSNLEGDFSARTVGIPSLAILGFLEGHPGPLPLGSQPCCVPLAHGCVAPIPPTRACCPGPCCQKLRNARMGSVRSKAGRNIETYAKILRITWGTGRNIETYAKIIRTRGRLRTPQMIQTWPSGWHHLSRSSSSIWRMDSFWLRSQDSCQGYLARQCDPRSYYVAGITCYLQYSAQLQADDPATCVDKVGAAEIVQRQEVVCVCVWEAVHPWQSTKGKGVQAGEGVVRCWWS